MDVKKMTTIIDGKALAQKVESEAAAKARALQAENIFPKLVTVLVGEDPASKMYVRMKIKACERIGIEAEDRFLPETASEEEVLALVRELNEDPSVSGILVQLPLPKQINAQTVMNAVDPKKDADGFHPFNMGNLMIGNEGLVPCTPKGVIRMFEEYDIDLTGKEAVVIGRSNDVGKPMVALLINRGATVTVCHSRTKDLRAATQKADILVVGIGKKHFIKEDMVKEGAVVIDVGITKDETGTHGDVDFENVSGKTSYITPVPGGVGPMTIAVLMTQVVRCAELLAGRGND